MQPLNVYYVLWTLQMHFQSIQSSKRFAAVTAIAVALASLMVDQLMPIRLYCRTLWAFPIVYGLFMAFKTIGCANSLIAVSTDTVLGVSLVLSPGLL